MTNTPTSAHPGDAVPFALEHVSTGPMPGAAILRLEQPGRPVVVLDHELIRRLDATLRSIPAGVTGLVLASASTRVFVAGADLRAITDWSDPQLDAYLQFAADVFVRLATLPVPTVAAINGAALGGGLELPMHCDAMVGAPGAKPYAVGLPETGLGLCPGWGGTNLLPASVNDPAAAIRATCEGKPFMFDEAVALGLFARVAPSQDQLIPAALEQLAELKAQGYPKHGGRADLWGQLPAQAGATGTALDAVRGSLPQTPAAAACVDALNVGLSRGYPAALDCERAHLVALRHTDTARQKLAEFFARATKG
jgi:enoyl-CoA hydratase/carnithine racemase